MVVSFWTIPLDNSLVLSLTMVKVWHREGINNNIISKHLVTKVNCRSQNSLRTTKQQLAKNLHKYKTPYITVKYSDWQGVGHPVEVLTTLNFCCFCFGGIGYML